MATEKMTYVRALSYVLTNCHDLPTDVVEKLESLRSQTEKRNSADKKPSKVQQENIDLSASLLALMVSSGESLTVSDWMAKGEPFASMSNQKVSALMRILETDGKVAKTTEKRKSYFKAIV